jgi:site-specific DNA recombinase
MSSSLPRRSLILARISDADWIRDLDGRRMLDTHGVDGQISDLLNRAAALGWTVGPAETHHITENDVSAFKRRMSILPDGRRERRPYRPLLWEALAMLRDGRADGLIAIDLDRAARDPRDLEDLIDVVESFGVPVESVTGTLRLATTSDISLARMLVAVANKSSADTARRVADSRDKAAAEGRYLRSGYRKFAFDPDGITIREDEAEILKAMAKDVLSGLSLRQLAADLREQGLVTASGKPWTPETIRATLTLPRYGGFLARRPVKNGRAVSGHVPYQESDITGPAPWADAWAGVIPVDTWRAVRAVLLDPSRRSSPGNTPKWLVSLIARCGHPGCGSLVAVGGGRRIITAYRCRVVSQHLRVHAEPVDQLVSEVVIGLLSRPDAVDIRRSGPSWRSARTWRSGPGRRGSHSARYARTAPTGTRTGSAPSCPRRGCRS